MLSIAFRLFLSIVRGVSFAHIDLPLLSFWSLPQAFLYVTDKFIEGRFPRLSSVDASSLGEYLLSMIVVHNAFEFTTLSSSVKNLVVLPNTCNEESLTTFSLPGFGQLRTIAIGENCFQHVNQFHLGELDELRSVTIGSHSFMNQTMSSKVFSLSNCEKLALLTIGEHSFAGFTSVSLSSKKQSLFCSRFTSADHTHVWRSPTRFR